jgi:hypothetical protein
MCDPVPIVTILHPGSFPRTVVGDPYRHCEGRSPVAISSLSLVELGFFDEKKEKDKRGEVHDAESTNESLKNSWEEEK